MGVSEEKSWLRRIFRQEREIGYARDSWIQLLASDEISKATVVASYLSYGSEPETSDINQQLLALGKVLLLPRLLNDNDLEWASWDGSTGSLKKNGKVFEPTTAKYHDEESIGVVIVPALRIDRTGIRLGQGGGSYDRALARLSNDCWKVGLIYAGELSATSLPAEKHDQALDAAATPHLVTRFYHEH